MAGRRLPVPRSAAGSHPVRPFTPADRGLTAAITPHTDPTTVRVSPAIAETDVLSTVVPIICTGERAPELRGREGYGV